MYVYCTCLCVSMCGLHAPTIKYTQPSLSFSTLTQFGSPQLLPKRIRLVVDVSGSMYRFNGHDRRLDRMLQAVLMVMEAFEKHDRKFKVCSTVRVFIDTYPAWSDCSLLFTFSMQLDITGHSGDSPSISFASSAAPPANDKERLEVLEVTSASLCTKWVS